MHDVDCTVLSEAPRRPASALRCRRGSEHSVTGTADRHGRRLLLPIIGFDDAGDEIAAHHVGAGEANGLDAGDAVQKRDGLLETRRHAEGQIDLARVAGDRHLRVLAKPGQEHLHLHAGRVLRLVQNDVGVGQRAPAHEGQRCNLDHARLQIALDLLGRQHVIEGIIERSQVGIDLLAHVAGQKAQPLAGLDGGARENDALDQPPLQAMRGVGDGKVGLARAGGPDAEHQIDFLQRADVGALHRRARLDDAAARGDLRLPVGGHRLLARMADEPVEIAGADLLAVGDARVKLLEHPARDIAGRLRAVEDDDVAMGVRFDAEAVLDQRRDGYRTLPGAASGAGCPRTAPRCACSQLVPWGTFPVPGPGSHEMLPIGAPDVVRFESSLPAAEPSILRAPRRKGRRGAAAGAMVNAASGRTYDTG